MAMGLPQRVEKFLESINIRLDALLEALRDQISSQEHTHADEQSAQMEARVTERQIKKRADTAAEAREQERFNKSYTQQVLSNVITLLGFFGALFVAFTAIGQWQEMVKATRAAEASAITADKSLNESAREFRKSLRELEAQTKAAQLSAQTAQDALTVQSRPWLSAEVSLQGGPIGNDSDLTFDRDGNLSITIYRQRKELWKVYRSRHSALRQNFCDADRRSISRSTEVAERILRPREDFDAGTREQDSFLQEL
jgi:ABC-type multidrug transport system fused ATPase/permease subunit